MTKCRISQIELCIESLLAKLNVDVLSRKEIVNYFLTVDTCGVKTHGLTILGAIVDKIEHSGFDIENSRIIIEREMGSFSVVNAHNTIGYASATQCMEYAINKCKEQGVYIVFCNHANTYGAAFYYTKLATDNKLIGITFSNSPAAMAPWGGKTKLIGTNPIAIGIPGKENTPFLFDMASSIVAKSKINEARKRNQKIPYGWATNREGIVTDDPIEAINGLVLPMAEAKGYGIALSVDILAGVLSGAGYLDDVNKFYSENNDGMNVGQVFITIDPTKVCSNNFFEKVDDYLNRLKESEPAGNNIIRYPGESKIDNYRYNRKEGTISLDDNVVEMINGLLDKRHLDMRICD